MSNAIERTLGLLELLAHRPGGLSLGAISSRLEMPPSATHRLLNDLVRLGYVRQDRSQGDYMLTIRLASLGLTFLAQSGVTDIAQPILDRLAQQCGELVRLSVADGGTLVWVAVAQGATGGLRYDPAREQGVVAHLASSAGGLAWLSTMSDDEALTLVTKQGVRPIQAGPGARAPKSVTEVLALLAETRARGYSVAVDSYLMGMAAMAVPVRYDGEGAVVGCLSIAAPTVRLDAARMAELIGPLGQAADEIGAAASASKYFVAARHRAAEAGQ
jgi:IclR family transcriptional regulator, acetate operon repressor